MKSAVRLVHRDHVDRLGEGLLWSPRQNAVFWVDILGQRLNRLSLADDSIAEWAMPEMVGWVVERKDVAGFLAGFASGVKALSLDPFALSPFACLPDEPPGNRLNDAMVDAMGRLWCGTMPIACDRPTGSFYRIDGNATVVRIENGYTVSNGPAISPDGQWLYHTDTVRGLVYRFALAKDGALGPREVWLRFREKWGRPDGMCCDADGGVWIAHWGGGRVSRFSPDAALDRSIDLPASQITNVAFAGERLDRMFVTSAADGVEERFGGALFEVAPGCRGVAPFRFAG